MEVRLDRKVALVAVSLCLMGQTSRAEGDPGAEAVPEPNWIPSIDIGFDFFKYETDATITDHVCANVTCDPQTSPGDPADWSGDQSRSTENIVLRLGGELLGPSFDAIPGRPRLFVQGGVQLAGFSSDLLFVRGDRADPFTAANGINAFNKRLAAAIERDCETRPAITCPVARQLSLDQIEGRTKRGF